MQAIPKEIHKPHEQHSVNTTMDGQSSPPKRREGKLRRTLWPMMQWISAKFTEAIKTHQAMHKLCTASMLSKSPEAVRMRSGQIICRQHRLGIDAWTD